ncbi:MAG TPA: PLP-dependent aminotransferase family protein [Vicinamibacterales bacterium]|nr:PLP-dependent aminotransferase family protein [Vicinamibacterales bacterium]
MPRIQDDEYVLSPRPAGEPAGRWLCARLRADIQAGRLGPGVRMPSSRRLAALARTARGTVVAALEQLESEGYLFTRRRSGTFVARRLATGPAKPAGAAKARARVASSVSELEPFIRFTASPQPFVTNLPALDLFPTAIWGRVTARRVRRLSMRDLAGCDVSGYRPLREAVADYLRRSRGVNCVTEQVVIVSGVQEALATIARLLVDPGERVLMEDPGYTGALRAFAAAGARVESVPVDSDGMTIPRRTGGPRIVYVTPAHQFPLGVTMTYERRLGLLEWARATSAFIVEDDYDSEYRYGGQPLPALQGLDAHDRVIFTGSFNKLLFPSLRLGYLVVPPSLVDPLVALRSAMGVHAPALDQAVLCDFITGGHLFRHVRRMRRVYAARRAALVDAVDSRLRGILELSDSEAGLQVPGRLLVPLDSHAVAAEAAMNGVLLTPLARYARRAIETDSLLLGFAAIDEREIRSGAARLAHAIDRLIAR